MNRRDALKGITALAVGIVTAPTEALTFPAEPVLPRVFSFSIGVDCSEGLSDASAIFIMCERRIIQSMLLPSLMLEARADYIPTIFFEKDGWPVSVNKNFSRRPGYSR